MSRHTLSLVAATFATLALAASTRAADLQTTYTVDDKALKAAVSGTPITFELYSDGACTTLVDDVTIAVDDIDLIERVKRFKPKGAVKPPNTVRLTEVLTGVSTAATLYLHVLGLGITPVGGTCQLQHASTAGAVVPCLTQVGDEVLFDGCNVNIRSGSGSTNGALNGLGNLIVGYNESAGQDRSGSHNLVIGRTHTYSGYGGLVAGLSNSIAGSYASVSGGQHNTASGSNASVSGGDSNQATGFAASVSGGANNTASGNWASVSGGKLNTASNEDASVSGGRNNIASGFSSAVSGGRQNNASGTQASVSGGQCNVAGAGPAPVCAGMTDISSVSGGHQNVASGARSSISGGVSNAALGEQASISGGFLNEARDNSSSVVGGQCNVAGLGPKKTGCTGFLGASASTVTGGFQNLASGNHSAVNGGNENIASGGSSVVSSGNGTTQANGFGWSAGAFGTLITGKFSSP